MHFAPRFPELRSLFADVGHSDFVAGDTGLFLHRVFCDTQCAMCFVMLRIHTA